MSNAEAIMNVTAVAAQVCGLADRTGTLEPGHDADLLAVAGNPLEDITAIHDVVAVFARGKPLRRQATARIRADGLLSSPALRTREGVYCLAAVGGCVTGHGSIPWGVNPHDALVTARLFSGRISPLAESSSVVTTQSPPVCEAMYHRSLPWMSAGASTAATASMPSTE